MVGRVAGWNLRIQLKIMKAITNRLKTIVVMTKDPGTLAELEGTHIFFSSFHRLPGKCAKLIGGHPTFSEMLDLWPN